MTSEYIGGEVGRSGHPGPARAALGFWSDVQYSDFARAYGRLSPSLRQRVSYRLFTKRVGRAVPRFLYRLRIRSVEENDDGVTTVYALVRKARSAQSRPSALAFNLSRIDGRWLLVTDPYNVLGVGPRGRLGA